MLQIWLSHATHLKESRTYEWVTYSSESCHTYEWVMSHTRCSHITRIGEWCHTYEWVVSHTWVSHVTHANESCHTYEFTHTNESCHACEWVMSRVQMRHVTYLIAKIKSNCFSQVIHMSWSRETLYVTHIIRTNESSHTRLIAKMKIYDEPVVSRIRMSHIA